MMSSSSAAGPNFEPFTEQDYTDHVDGRPRADWVRKFVASRGIELANEHYDDPPGATTVNGIGKRKNELLHRIIDEEGLESFRSSVRYLEAVRKAGLAIAVVTSSANGASVLHVTGLMPGRPGPCGRGRDPA